MNSRKTHKAAFKQQRRERKFTIKQKQRTNELKVVVVVVVFLIKSLKVAHCSTEPNCLDRVNTD